LRQFEPHPRREKGEKNGEKGVPKRFFQGEATLGLRGARPFRRENFISGKKKEKRRQREEDPEKKKKSSQALVVPVSPRKQSNPANHAEETGWERGGATKKEKR